MSAVTLEPAPQDSSTVARIDCGRHPIVAQGYLHLLASRPNSLCVDR